MLLSYLDPKLPLSFDRVLRNLESNVEDSISSVQRSTGGEDQSIEMIFAVDLSSDVSFVELQNAFAFALERAKKVITCCHTIM